MPAKGEGVALPHATARVPKIPVQQVVLPPVTPPPQSGSTDTTAPAVAGRGRSNPSLTVTVQESLDTCT